MTLNEIIRKLLKPLSEDHLMLKDFGFGDLTNYANGQDIKYPIMWVVLNNVRYSEKSLAYSLSLIFADIAKDDISNSLEIQSDMIQVAADIASKLVYAEDDDLDVSSEFNLKPFSERFADVCSGVVMDITIKSSKLLNECEFPSIDALSSGIIITEDGDGIITEGGDSIIS
jgi:hypothetical protein